MSGRARADDVQLSPAGATAAGAPRLDPLAMRVLEGEFKEGDRVLVDVGASGLSFEKKQSVPA